MSTFKMTTDGGGISRGSSLPLVGEYHGQPFELIKDNLSSPVLYYWNDLLKDWKPFDSGSSTTYYSNNTPMPITLGGYSLGTTFSEPKTIQEMLDGLLYPYISPTISLGTTVSTIQELGTSLASIQLNTSISRKSDDIVKIEYYKNGSLLYTNNNPNSNGGTDSYKDLTGINNSITYSVKVYDDKPNSVSSSLNFSYIYPMYIGNLNSLSPTEIEVKSMTKKLVTNTNQSLTYTLSNSRFCFSYPSLYGNLSSIKDPNNFEMLSAFTKTTSNFIMLDGKAISYNIYTLSLPTSQTNFTITYIF